MKFLKLVLVCSLVFFSACSQMEKKQSYVAVEKNSMGKVVNVEFAGQCAYSVAQGEFKSKGQSGIKHEDNKGRIYYFQSEEAKNKFVSSIKKHRAMASMKWTEFQRSIDR